MKYYCLKYGENYFARDKISTGSYYLTTNRFDAVAYEEKDKIKLQHIKNSLPKKYQKNKIILTYYEIEEEVECGAERIDIKNINKDIKEDGCNTVFDDIESIKDKIADLSKDFKSILESKDELLRQLSEVDTKISDELHYIEFYKFSASEGYKLCKQLQEFRDERRNIKKNLEIINIIQSQTCSNLALGSTSKAFDSVDNKMYSPRILTGLFEGKESKRRKIG